MGEASRPRRGAYLGCRGWWPAGDNGDDGDGGNDEGATLAEDVDVDVERERASLPSPTLWASIRLCERRWCWGARCFAADRPAVDTLLPSSTIAIAF